ncbi:putative metal transport-related, exported protein [Flavobacteriales bacterium ALC-1]|nr:putative metal transport-related, exported protein [Flavobacteriales bacterium ALC-1]
MTKKVGIYIGFVIIGFVLSYLLFGLQKDQNTKAKNDTKNITYNEWTCAMHPQIKEQESGTCPLCAMDLVVVNTDNNEDGLSNNQLKMTKTALALANIETSEVSYNKEDKAIIQLSGIISTNKKTDAIQTTVFDGRIEKLQANYVGTKIRKGKQIGLIYSPELYLAQNKLLSSVTYRKTHPLLFDEVRNSLGLWKMTDEQIENIIVREKPMTNFPIYADVSGTVTEIMASEGSFYRQGDPLLKISDLRTVWAIFDAYESQLSSLKIGQSLELKSNAFPNGDLTGKIDFIDPILSKSKRTASVRVLLNNRNGKLKPGMLIEASIISKLSEEVLTIPKTAALWTGKRSIVYRKPYPDKPYFEMTEVILGQSLKDNYEVLSGLEIGDIIVTEGAFTIDAAAQLQGKKSMMSTVDNENYLHNNHQNKEISNKLVSIDWEMIQRDDLNTLIEGYFMMKDALVASDSKMAKHYGNEVLKTLKKLDLKKLSETHKKNIELLLNTTKSFVSTSDLKKQRLSFKPLSKLIIDIVSKSKNLNKITYIQYCPMADQNKGAKWLSLEKEIMNPYFGDKMLNCGSILEEI